MKFKVLKSSRNLEILFGNLEIFSAVYPNFKISSKEFSSEGPLGDACFPSVIHVSSAHVSLVDACFLDCSAEQIASYTDSLHYINKVTTATDALVHGTIVIKSFTATDIDHMSTLEVGNIFKLC